MLLEWFADSPDPDAGLFGFRRISESLGRTPWYLTMLRDEGEVAQRLALVLGTSRYATDLLEREPQGVKMLGESLVPLSAEAVLAEMQALVERAETPEAAVARGAWPYAVASCCGSRAGSSWPGPTSRSSGRA